MLYQEIFEGITVSPAPPRLVREQDSEIRSPRHPPYHRASQREMVRRSLDYEVSRDVYPLRNRRI